jgi:hypothetical protein
LLIRCHDSLFLKVILFFTAGKNTVTSLSECLPELAVFAMTGNPDSLPMTL